MELNDVSATAFSLAGMIGHASYVLLILSMLMTRMVLLRVVAVFAGLLSIVYSLMIADHVSAFWEVLFVAVNLGQLLLLIWRNRMTHFTAEERLFRAQVVPLLEPGLARRLIAIGQWRTATPGSVLIQHGEMVTHMLFLAAGEAEIRVGACVVGSSGPGALVGEISVLTHMPATATVTARTEVRCLALERHALHKLSAREPAIGQAIDQSFRTGLRHKLNATNAALADAEARATVLSGTQATVPAH